MDQELKSITIKSMIDNLAINNKVLTSDDISFLKNKFVNSNKKLKDIETQINYEIAKLEKKRRKQEKKEKETSRKIEKDNVQTEKEYIMYTYQSVGVSSSKKVKVEPLHLGEENLNKPIHVLVNNSIKGYLKMKDSGLIDNVDLALAQMSSLYHVRTTSIYRIEDTLHNKGILSIDILNDSIKENHTIGEIINKNYNQAFLGKKYASWVKELISLPNSDKEHPIFDTFSIKSLIDLGLKVVYETYPNMSEEEKDMYKKEYFQMLIFDFVTNQLDRNSENFGISVTKENKIILTDLYDNGCVVDYDNLDKDSMRFMMKICNRSSFIHTLFQYYFQEIKDIVEEIISDKELLVKTNNIVDVYLDEEDAIWYKGVLDLNVKTLRKLYKDHINVPKKKRTSQGYVQIIQNSILVAICCIILGFVIGLYFVLKTK